MTKLRIAFLSAYFGMYDDVMPGDFRPRQQEAAARLRGVLAAEFDVLDLGMIADAQGGRMAADALASDRVDAIVYAPAMVAPPAWVIEPIRASKRPVVIWNGPAIDRLPTELTHVQATVNTTQVGCQMLANCLIRDDRWFTTVTASPHHPADGELVRRTVRAAAVAGRLGQMIALRIGDPIPGYDDVMASEDALALLGVQERRIAPDDWRSAVAAVEEEKASALIQGLGQRPGWRIEDNAANLDSARIALALEQLAEWHGAPCGTVNCHGAFFRDNPEIGITACLGVSLLAEKGVAISCTGDLPAALSLFVADRLSSRALYCEAYVLEFETGLMLVAAGGEGDPRWADREGIRVLPNTYYKDCRGAGASLGFLLEPGTATLISLSPSARSWRMAWATGEIVEGRYRDLDGPNGMFRFDRTAPDAAASAWIASGATHHHALAKGRLDEELRLVAGALGIEGVPV